MDEWVSVHIAGGEAAFTHDALADVVARHARVSREVAESIAARVLAGGSVSLDVPSAELAGQLRHQLETLGLRAG